MPGFSKLRALARAIYDRLGAHHPWTYASAIASGRLSPSSPGAARPRLLGAFDLEEVWSDSVAPAIKAHVTAPVAVGSLTVFLVLTAYVFVSAAIFLLGVEVDETLRKSSRKS